MVGRGVKCVSGQLKEVDAVERLVHHAIDHKVIWLLPTLTCFSTLNVQFDGIADDQDFQGAFI